MSIADITATRQALAEELIPLVEAAGAKFKELEASNISLMSALADLEHSRGRKIIMCPVPGIEKTRDRVKVLIENAFFEYQAPVDLVSIVTGENAAALREVANG